MVETERNGGWERYLGKRIDRKLTSILMRAAKDREATRTSLSSWLAQGCSLNDQVTPLQKLLQQTPAHPAPPGRRGLLELGAPEDGWKEEQENGHSLSVRELQGHWHWSGTGGTTREQAFPLPARNLHLSPPPPQPGRAAPLLAPGKRWFTTGVWGCGAEAHPSSPDPPRPGAHPAQCAGRLGVGSAQSRALEPGCLVSPRVRESSAPMHLPDGRTGSMSIPSGPSSASLSPLAPSSDVRASSSEGAGVRVRAGCFGSPKAASVHEPGVPESARAPARVPAAGLRWPRARLVARGVRSPARGRRPTERGGGRLGAWREDAGWELFARPGSTSFRARRGSPRPPGERRERVPAAPPPLPPPASSSFPAPRARASRGRPAAQPHPGRPGSLPRPRCRLAGADRLSQPERRRGR